jgi:hypothetical protein
MRWPMRVILVGFVTLAMEGTWLGALQSHDGDPKEPTTIGKIAWQDDTGG